MKQRDHQLTYKWTPLWRVQAQVQRKHLVTAAVDQLIGVNGREGQALASRVIIYI
jgi:hypothetical protein